LWYATIALSGTGVASVGRYDQGIETLVDGTRIGGEAGEDALRLLVMLAADESSGYKFIAAVLLSKRV
jgi:hypothetical protein